MRKQYSVCSIKLWLRVSRCFGSIFQKRENYVIKLGMTRKSKEMYRKKMRDNHDFDLFVIRQILFNGRRTVNF